MGRHVGRSRGCQVCRQRRIKCDEKTPACSQCLRSGKPCPGPLQGTLFIDMVNEGHDNSKTVRDNKPAKRSPGISFRGKSSLQSKPLSETKEKNRVDKLGVDNHKTIETIPSKASQASYRDRSAAYNGLQFASVHQPSRADLYQPMFIEYFISAFFHPRRRRTTPNEWMSEIPSFLDADPSSAMICSLRATTMAHYGKLTGDADMQFEACRWYDKGLEKARLESEKTQLELAQGGSINDHFTEATICAPLMFSLFECLMTTSFTAWTPHMKAAGKMLEMRGPTNCQDGTIHHLFRSVRFGVVTLGMHLERPSVFASEEWCTVPFEHLGKRPLDRIGDILLQFPEICLLRNSMRSLRELDDQAAAATSRTVGQKASHLLSWLAQFWDEYRDDINPEYDHSRFAELSDFQTDAAHWVMEETSIADFDDTFAATTIAFYDAATVLANALAWEATDDDPQVYKRRIVTHCASILSVVAHHESVGVGSGGSNTMIFPIKLVCRVTPSDHQRRKAEECLAIWGKKRGVDGICKFAIPEKLGIFRSIERMEKGRAAKLRKRVQCDPGHWLKDFVSDQKMEEAQSEYSHFGVQSDSAFSMEGFSSSSSTSSSPDWLIR